MTDRGWTLLRAALLVGATVTLAPISPVPLVFVPLALLLLAFRTSDWMSVGVACLILVLGFAGGHEGEMEWVVPRAWALIAGGAFVAVTAARGRLAPFARSMVALGLALGVIAGLGAARPTILGAVDWWIASEIRRAALVATGILGRLQSADPELQTQLAAAVQRWIGFQQDVYPALLALATLAALGLAWFGFERLSGTVRSPGPVREFRFSDHLVWLLIGGLSLLVLPLGRTAFRVGENAALFMGGLYLLRGAAILVWVGAAAVTSVWTGLLLTLAALFLYPVALGTALVLGLSDTWIDLRTRLSRNGSVGDL